MRNNVDPYWLETPFMGFDGEENEEDNEEENSEEESSEESSGEGSGDDVEKLKRALRAERKLKRAAEKENRALRKAQEDRDSQDQQTTDEAREEAQLEKTKSARLAARLRISEENNAITKHANLLKFIDVDDAISLISRDDLDVDQDEDDPSIITIEETSVVDALKDLARRKPHLLRGENEEEQEEEDDPRKLPTGSKFGGSKKKKRDADEAELRDLYPALR